MEEQQEIKKKRMTREEYCKILDEVNAVKLYTEDHWSQEQISKEFGVSKGSVGTYLRTIKGIQIREAKRRPELRETYPIGTKFGLWTIISDEVKVGSESGKGRNLYQLCQCCCGNIQWKALSALRAGTTTRCKKCGNKTYLTENGEVNINSMILSFYRHIVDGIKKRKKVSELEFNITPEYLEKLYEEQNRKCAISGLSLELDITKAAIKQNWSLDRIDSNKGYIEGNVQWVHKDINRMKQSYSNKYFKEMCCKVAEQNGYSKCN